jgi:methionine synthase II (cobalamin-independent)
MEKFEDTKVVIIWRQSKTDRQYYDQMKKDKGTNSDLQSITQNTKDRAIRTPVKTRVELMRSWQDRGKIYTHFPCLVQGLQWKVADLNKFYGTKPISKIKEKGK